MGKPPGEDLRKFGWVCDCSRVGFAACAGIDAAKVSKANPYALRNFRLNNTHAPSKPNQFRVNACGFAHRPSTGSLLFPSRFTVLRFIMPQLTRQNKSLGRRHVGRQERSAAILLVFGSTFCNLPQLAIIWILFMVERVIHQLQQCMPCIFPVFLSVTAVGTQSLNRLAPPSRWVLACHFLRIKNQISKEANRLQRNCPMQITTERTQ